jgi:hypothetical protein
MQLMSAEQIADHDCRVILDPDVCYIQDRRTGHLVGTGPRRRDSQRLWELNWLHLPSAASASPVSSACAASSTLSFAQCAQWHHRLGHLSGPRLSALLRRGVLGSVSGRESLDHCQGCRLRKQVQLPYPSGETMSQRPFDLVHSDVCGPAPFVSKGGHKYYIIFIDDFSRHTWIYFMKHRSETLSIYKNFSAMILTHFDTPIRDFRVDSVGEYLSDALRQVLAEQGTLAQFSCLGAHAQNRVAERKYRHLLETARALMIASSVPPHFWARAVSTATYLINIQPFSTLPGGIPFENLCGKTADYSSLRLFGCVCYVLLAPRERTKLAAQSVECVFLCYSAEHKGYRCWDSVARRMRTSRDVVFDESHPFYSRPTTDATPASFIDPLSFLFFPDAPPASLPLTRPTLPTSVSSTESSPVVPDYTVKSPVTQVYSRRGARLSEVPTSSAELSSDVSSSSLEVPSSPPIASSSPIGSSPEQLLGCGQRICRPPNCYSSSAFTATALSKPASYRDAILHPEWHVGSCALSPMCSSDHL